MAQFTIDGPTREIKSGNEVIAHWGITRNQEGLWETVHFPKTNNSQEWIKIVRGQKYSFDVNSRIILRSAKQLAINRLKEMSLPFLLWSMTNLTA